MSNNPSDRREIILLEDIPRSGTPDPARRDQIRTQADQKSQERVRPEEAKSLKREIQRPEGHPKQDQLGPALYQRTLRSVGPWEGLLPKRHLRYPPVHQWTLRIVRPRERRMPRRHLRWAPVHQWTLRIVRPQDRQIPRRHLRYSRCSSLIADESGTATAARAHATPYYSFNFDWGYR